MVFLSLNCHIVSDSRHDAAAPTQTRPVPAGTGIAAHHHDEHQVLYTSQGVISVTTTAGVWVTAPGRALWIPAGVTHRHRAVGQARIHTVGLPSTTTPLHLPHETPAVIAVDSLLRQLLITYTGERDDESSQRARLLSVLVDRLDTADEEALWLPNPSDTRLRQLAELLDANPAEHRSAPRLAREVGASSRTLSRLCHDELHLSFPQWRTRIRIHHALQLLARGTSVTSVARQCGWATSSAFIEAFRATMGHTPKTARCVTTSSE